ncbi:lipocalin-like domain-containing protein [Shewanella sp. WE21]|uniref:lipocalin-like domain-containing protein n=1 Tax=Shewanella sp. WE21 TaxID=2029986 RepID=UPI00131A3C53|nr:lipocalin-like domain-containing protein [Shewanella sp. WE21]
MNQEKLIGTWEFVSCVAKTSTGEVNYPWGQDSSGLLTYTADGYVFVSRMSVALKEAASKLVPGSQEEALAVVAGFEAYSGKYTVKDNLVTHHVQMCSTPVHCGTEQSRYFEFNGDEISLTTKPVEFEGVTHTAYLVWRRVQP